MGNGKCGNARIEDLKSKLGKMLKESDGKINKDIIEISKELDKLILQELKIRKDKKHLHI